MQGVAIQKRPVVEWRGSSIRQGQIRGGGRANECGQVGGQERQCETNSDSVANDSSMSDPCEPSVCNSTAEKARLEVRHDERMKFIIARDGAISISGFLLSYRYEIPESKQAGFFFSFFTSFA